MRTTSVMAHPLGGFGAVTLAVAALLGAGCDESPPTLPVGGASLIYGRVIDGGDFASDHLEIRAESVGDFQDEFWSETQIAADGTYSLTVPNGRVLLYCGGWYRSPVYYSARGPQIDRSAADTLDIAGGVVEVNLTCGRAHVEVDLPAELQNQQLECGLRPAGDLDGWSVFYRVYASERLVADLSVVPPGRYVIRLWHSDYGSVYLPATIDPADADVIEIAAGAETRYASTFGAITTVSGLITGSWQTFGADEPRVECYGGGSRQVETYTDSTGAFTFRLLGGGDLRFSVSIGGITRWIGGYTEDEATVFEVAAGADTTIAYEESGLLVSVAGVELDDWVRILVYDQSRRYIGMRTGGSAIRLSNLCAGDAFLKVEPTSSRSLWLPQYYDDQDSLSVADPIAIPAGGQVASVTVTPVIGGRIRGRLLDAGGGALNPSRAAVALHAAADSSDVLAVYTSIYEFYDEITGDYQINHLADGSYKLRARGSNEAWTWWPGRASWDSAGVITIENHADVTGVDWRLLD